MYILFLYKQSITALFLLQNLLPLMFSIHLKMFPPRNLINEKPVSLDSINPGKAQKKARTILPAYSTGSRLFEGGLGH